jgi:hypothetical protein
LIHWLIISDDPSTWHVEKGSFRTVYSGDYDECEDYVRAHRSMRDQVARVEPDGYRWDLSTHLR